MPSAPILKHYPLVNTTFDPPWFSLDNTFKMTEFRGEIYPNFLSHEILFLFISLYGCT
jgi:hypothetical protein